MIDYHPHTLLIPYWYALWGWKSHIQHLSWTKRPVETHLLKGRVSWNGLFGLLWFEGHFWAISKHFWEKYQKYKNIRNFMKKQKKIFFWKIPPLTPFWNFEISPDLTFIRPLEHFEPSWKKNGTITFSLKMIPSP